jgi:hypothetical protein
MRSIYIAALIGAAFVSTSAAQPAPPPCTAAGDVQFICGQQAPEDLVVLPGGQWVVAGSFGGNGGINVIRVSDRTSVRAYPTPTTVDTFDAKAYKGCPGAPDTAMKAKFLTHGLSLRAGRNNVHTLYVVAHGARESVEVFTLDARPPTPTLTWIGCAVAPDPIGLNSVRWLDDGGFIATNFNPRGNNAGFGGLQKGEKNGELWEWHAASGWQKVPGSEASGANGIEISPDGRTLYVAAWGSQSFFRLSRGGKDPTREEIPLGFRVDNVRWATDGSLLATGQGGEGPQAVTVVVRIDPKTLKPRELLRRPAVNGFTAGTVAVEVGKTLWVGSFIGDRIAVFPLR